jgi:hypothetical protein
VKIVDAGYKQSMNLRMSWTIFLYCHISYLSCFAPDVRPFLSPSCWELAEFASFKEPRSSLELSSGALLGNCRVVFRRQGRESKVSQDLPNWTHSVMIDYDRIFKI